MLDNIIVFCLALSLDFSMNIFLAYICGNFTMTPFYPPKGQVMNIENVMRYEKLSFTAKEHLYSHTKMVVPFTSISTKHKVM